MKTYGPIPRISDRLGASDDPREVFMRIRRSLQTAIDFLNVLIANHQAGAMADGYFLTTRVTAPADADLLASQMAVWLDPTPGAAALNVKAKDSAGTVVTATIPLT